jgi:hypothetical protein
MAAVPVRDVADDGYGSTDDETSLQEDVGRFELTCTVALPTAPYQHQTVGVCRADTSAVRVCARRKWPPPCVRASQPQGAAPQLPLPANPGSSQRQGLEQQEQGRQRQVGGAPRAIAACMLDTRSVHTWLATPRERCRCTPATPTTAWCAQTADAVRTAGGQGGVSHTAVAGVAGGAGRDASGAGGDASGAGRGGGAAPAPDPEPMTCACNNRMTLSHARGRAGEPPYWYYSCSKAATNLDRCDYWCRFGSRIQCWGCNAVGRKWRDCSCHRDVARGEREGGNHP